MRIHRLLAEAKSELTEAQKKRIEENKCGARIYPYPALRGGGGRSGEVGGTRSAVFGGAVGFAKGYTTGWRFYLPRYATILKQMGWRIVLCFIEHASRHRRPRRREGQKKENQHMLCL